MPLQATSGAASYDAFGGGVPVVPTYIEEVFSTWLYSGNSSTQTITNGIDLSTKGGLIWVKSRSNGEDYYDHVFCDTVRGSSSYLASSGPLATAGEQVKSVSTLDITSFNANGFSIGPDQKFYKNVNGATFASWTFRKQPKFFDCVTYTGNGSSSRAISHNLGSSPGCMFVKCTSSAGTSWNVYHRSLGSSQRLMLNTTAAADGGVWGGLNPNSTSFFVGSNSDVNASGDTYVAYLFAHNAGGFGLTGTDNVISCGSYTGGADVAVNVGFEPQWVLTKAAGTEQNWVIHDTMRGYTVNATGQATLHPNNSDAEDFGFDAALTSTGFRSINSSTGVTYIYIAIRRGPMKVPTTGTSVFDQEFYATPADGKAPMFKSNVIVDAALRVYRPGGVAAYPYFAGRLTGTNYLTTSSTAAEATSTVIKFDYMDGWGSNTASSSDTNNLAYMFRRAPGFMDVCCYTGTGSGMTVPHNLTVAPEMLIFKRRDATRNWAIVHANAVNRTSSQPPVLTGYDVSLNFTDTGGLGGVLNSTPPTNSLITLSSSADVNASGGTYVAYLFASAPGVSKVGGYTGTGTTQTINCGFTAGSRFVLIKRTDDVGDWYVWDSARGIVAGNDPYLLLNSTAAEVTNTDYIDTAATGFEISSTAPAAINASGGTFIFLAIA